MKKLLFVIQLFFSLQVFAGSSSTLVLLPPFYLTTCPPNPYPFYPWDAFCNSSIGNNDEYALFVAEDSLLYKLSNGHLFVNTPGCPPLPNPYYPYDASCNLTIGNNDLYAQWYVLHLIDSLLSSGGGPGNISGNIAAPHLVFASAANTLSDMSWTYVGGNVVQASGSFMLGATNTYFTLNGSGGSVVTGRGNSQLAINPSNSTYILEATPNRYIQTSNTIGTAVTDSLKVTLNSDTIIFPYQPTVGYLWTCKASDGSGYWAAESGIGGSGTTNYVPKFTGSTTIGNSQIYDNNTGGVGINTTSNTDGYLQLAVPDIADPGIAVVRSSNSDQYTYLGGINGTNSGRMEIFYNNAVYSSLSGPDDASFLNMQCNHGTGVMVSDINTGQEGGLLYISGNSHGTLELANNGSVDIQIGNHNGAPNFIDDGVTLGIGVPGNQVSLISPLTLAALPFYASNTAAHAAGEKNGALYNTLLLSGDTVVKQVH